MIDHIAIRDKLVRRFYSRPGSVARIAAEEFPEADAADIAAAARHVESQVKQVSLSSALAHDRAAAHWTRRRWTPADL